MSVYLTGLMNGGPALLAMHPSTYAGHVSVVCRHNLWHCTSSSRVNEEAFFFQAFIDSNRVIIEA